MNLNKVSQLSNSFEVFQQNSFSFFTLLNLRKLIGNKSIFSIFINKIGTNLNNDFRFLSSTNDKIVTHFLKTLLFHESLILWLNKLISCCSLLVLALGKTSTFKTFYKIYQKKIVKKKLKMSCHKTDVKWNVHEQRKTYRTRFCIIFFTINFKNEFSFLNSNASVFFLNWR